VISVKRVLLLSAFLAASPVSAEISAEVKASCMDAKDFVGCVQALSGSSSIRTNSLESLKKALKRLPSRLGNTNLRDFRLIHSFSTTQLLIFQRTI
jgi:hypothetical protein